MFPTVAHNCHGKRNNIAAKERDSRQKGITSRQKGKGSQKNKKPHGKNKKTHGKRKNLPASTALFSALRTLLFLLPWGYFFSHESFTFALRFFFCRESFLFAVRFFFCREVFPFAVNLFLLAFRFFLLPFVFAAKLFLWPWQFWATVVPRFYSLLGGLTFDMLLSRISLERWDLLLEKLILRSDKLIYTTCGGTPCPLQTYFISVCY